MAFFLELWGAFRKGSSFWLEFMYGKYCNGIYPCPVEISLYASAIWRRMVNVSRQVELFILWLIHKENCDFWYDNWLGTGPLYLKVPVLTNTSFRDFIVNGAWNTQRLGQVLAPNLIT